MIVASFSQTVAFCQVICRRSQEPESCPLLIICFGAMSFALCGKAKRSLRLITEEKMIMIVLDKFSIEGNHANL